jgi:hypothetical protein
MKQEVGSREQGVGAAKVQVRGTQSFVGVMVSVWRRPSLGFLEMTWRAVAMLAFLWVAAVALGSLGMDVHLKGTHRGGVDLSALQAMTAFKPVAAVKTLRSAGSAVFAAAWPTVHWALVEAAIFWLIVAALGRTLVLRRLDPSLKPATWSMLVLGALRALLLGMVWAAWFWGVAWAARVEITGPGAAGAEPNLVGFCGLVICGTLGLYVAWGAASWPLQLAPLLAMRYRLGPGAGLARAFQAGPVRGKLMEVNLVMNIVKLALIVLAMVFSASPLPFTAVATQTFLASWWLGVGALYVGMSDYFQVVRSAAYLKLWATYHPESLELAD